MKHERLQIIFLHMKDRCYNPNNKQYKDYGGNKGYSPENCRWVSMKVQQNNKRNNRLITHKGKTQTIAQWCEELGLPFSTVKNRLNRHLPTEKILSKSALYCEKIKRIM